MVWSLPPAWRERLKKTRWPILRQMAQAARLVARLKRLGRTEDLVEELNAQCRSLEERLAIGARQLETCSRDLTTAYLQLNNQLDLLKSALEVPREWFEEFRLWKKENPLPETPLVSVCVATWNRAQLLAERCLASLLRQTYERLEIIVVGDHCTDDTANRIASLGDARVRFINLPRRGRYPEEPRRCWMVAGSTPANHALSLCTGDFITHLDDDDEHDATRVEKLVDFARANDLDFVWHPFQIEVAPDQWVLCPSEEFRYSQVTTSSIFYRRWLTRIGWDLNAHMLSEPGDWNRLRKFLYLGVKAERFPEALLRHYAERTQHKAA